VDLAEWFVAGRWVGLLDLIDGLPSACRLNEAIVNDKETAAELAALPKPEREWAPGIAEYDLHAHILREILHGIKSLRQVSIAVAGGKPGEEQMFPAPFTEIDRAIQAAERQWAESFIGGFGFDAADI
jgi:hypothetical protein